MQLRRADTSLSQYDELKDIKYHDKYVVVYDFTKVDDGAAVKEFCALMKDLESVGLQTEVRVGYDQTLLVFVQAPRDLLGNTVYRSRVKDWLYGIVKHHPGGTKDTVVSGSFEAEDLLAMYHLVNWRKELGGAGITPEFGKWENVTSIFPLHNHRTNQQLLVQMSKKVFLSLEDLDSIRGLWGAKVAFYFAFIQTYFFFLIFPCIAGIFAWAFLPKYSLFFAIVIGIWCTIFLEFWKIKEVDLSIRWDVRGVGSLKVDRPQFVYEKTFVDSAGRVIHYFPRWKRIVRQAVAIPFVFVSTVFLGALIAAVFAIETFISEAYEGEYKIYLEYLPTVLLAVLLPYISNYLEEIAAFMTKYENHRTSDHHEMSLTQKIFILNFITDYLPIFLTAFVYVPFGDFIIPRLQYFVHSVAGNAIPAGKVAFKADTDRLRNEVIALTVTGQVGSMIEELALPYLKTQIKQWYRAFQTRRLHRRADTMPLVSDDPSEARFLRRARKQATLPSYDVQEDISEMVLQFGYLALFSPVWPLIPIGFFINNWFELRGDFLKICIEHQRPSPSRADGIGPWVSSLEALTWLGSITSAAIVHLFGSSTEEIYAFTGIGRWYTLPITIFVSEHLFLAFRAAVRFSLSRIGSQQIRKERAERYAERKKYLDELEQAKQKSAHLNVMERERRKSIRMTGEELFWRKQAEEGASAEAGVEIILALKNGGERIKVRKDL